MFNLGWAFGKNMATGFEGMFPLGITDFDDGGNRTNSSVSARTRSLVSNFAQKYRL
jgi:hypothetical protein